MNRPRLIIGVWDPPAQMYGMWDQARADDGDAEKELAEKFPDYEVHIIYGATGMVVLPSKKEEG